MISETQSLLADRYVPIRRDLSADHFSTYSHLKSTNTSTNLSYQQLLTFQDKRCLSFQKQALTSTQYTDMHLTKNPLQRLKAIKIDLKLTRTVKNHEILRVRYIMDSFYHNVLDWSKDEILCIASEKQCNFMYKNKEVAELNFSPGSSFWKSPKEVFSSVKFSKEGRSVYLANESGDIQVFDTETTKPLRKIQDHMSRVSCLQNTTDWGFLSGSKDKSIIHHDTRLKKSRIFKLLAHSQEVCGITLNNNKVASSSNDGKIFLWDLTNDRNVVKTHSLHGDAVKAIKWCPWKVNLLASGGGKKDHKIILWNTQSESVEQILQGNTQITGLQWNEKTKDLISAHSGSKRGGYMTVWNYQIKQFTHLLAGHTKRIVSMCLNPQNKNHICSIGADQTLRFWNIRSQEPQIIRKHQGMPRISQGMVLK